ncbi:MAG TPA: acyl carrier protein [Polyangiaceae bacterium]
MDHHSTELEARVMRAVAQCVPRAFASREIGRAQRLKDELGLDSLGLMSLAFRLEDELAVDLAPHTDALRALGSVDDLVRFVAALPTRHGKGAA